MAPLGEKGTGHRNQEFPRAAAEESKKTAPPSPPSALLLEEITGIRDLQEKTRLGEAEPAVAEPMGLVTSSGFAFDSLLASIHCEQNLLVSVHSEALFEG